ncbi:hypothetical protein RRG08_038940 [Elysia crispata]|uniref:Uncharacterized protein n=1 Tax=Elysia crispata TaxID=231223 RepID=A0AAE1CU63_9GAST|nr:hypothetical protein RRG08_038940 [Elysia crispata]
MKVILQTRVKLPPKDLPSQRFTSLDTKRCKMRLLHQIKMLYEAIVLSLTLALIPRLPNSQSRTDHANRLAQIVLEL